MDNVYRCCCGARDAGFRGFGLQCQPAAGPGAAAGCDGREHAILATSCHCDPSEAGLVEMLRVPGLGPGRIRTLNKELGVETVDALEEACRDGRVAALKGYGKKSADRMIRGIRWYRENLA